MLSTLRTASAVALSISLFLQTSTAASATTSAASASSSVVLSAMTYVGCFNSSTPLTNQGSYTWQTSGYCQPICVGKNQPVLGLTGGSYCYCGSLLPAADSEQVDDSNCKTPCTGYGDDDCGGTGYWSVYLTGTDTEVSNYVASSSSAASSATATASPSKSDGSSAATTSTPSVITSIAPGKTVIITQSSNPTSTSSSASDTQTEHKSSGGPNTAGIAAGVVVGIVVLAALVGAGFFYMRRRNRRQIEEEYSKRTQAQDFMASGTGNQRGMSVRSAGNDSRLDPEFMAHHRLSDGSIADNQDYSRRILKVTNPDGS